MLPCFQDYLLIRYNFAAICQGLRNTFSVNSLKSSQYLRCNACSQVALRFSPSGLRCSRSLSSARVESLSLRHFLPFPSWEKSLQIYILPAQGGSYENGACFYQPPFLSGKFTLKFLTLQTYLVGGRSENAGKFQAYRHKELVNRNSKIADGNCSAQVQPDASIGLVQ